MQTIYTVGSITNAMRGKRLLEKHGIRAYIRKTNADRERGCSYGILVLGASPDVAAIFRAGGVSVLKVQGREGP